MKTTIDEARALFSQPPDGDKPDKVDDEIVDVESKVEAAKSAAAKGVPGNWSAEEKLVLTLAEKRGSKFVVLEHGGDAIVLFGKHRGKKVSVLSVDPSGRDYLRWMSGQQFDEALLKVVRMWLART